MRQGSLSQLVPHAGGRSEIDKVGACKRTQHNKLRDQPIFWLGTAACRCALMPVPVCQAGEGALYYMESFVLIAETPMRIPNTCRCCSLALAAGLLLGLAGCKKSGYDVAGTDESKDHIAPLEVVDLSVTRMSPTGVGLCWTASGDDRDVGTASSYVVRYLGHAITPENWDSATMVTSLPVPGPPHSIDSVLITGLLEDSTYFFALRVSDEVGNWSGLSNVVEAVCFDDYVVSFPDTAFEGVVRFYANKLYGEIHRSDLLPVWRLSSRNRQIHNLTGIEHCRNIGSLELWENQVSDLGPLSGLTSLRSVKINLCRLADIGPLSSLHDLDTLHLRANQIENVAALSAMTHLTELDLSANRIWNTGPLAGKITIRSLDLSNNQIQFTNPLYDLSGLDRLRLSNNLINDLLPLLYNFGLAAGDTLWLDGNPLGAVSTDSLLGVFRDRGVIVVR